MREEETREREGVRASRRKVIWREREKEEEEIGERT